jgi:hypothetical protein
MTHPIPRNANANSATLSQQASGALASYPGRLLESIPFTSLLLLASGPIVQAAPYQAPVYLPAGTVESADAAPITRIDAIRDLLIAFLGSSPVYCKKQTPDPSQSWSNWGNWYNN